MAETQGNTVLRQVRRLVAAQAASRLTDRQLLEHFLARQDESAFAELVQRHGPAVLTLCRSLLRHEQDAEDIFQATFLVLARKASSIRKREALGSWLYGVAHRLACKARARAARRSQLAPAAAGEPEAVAPDNLTWRELRLVLHEELSRLPEKYRAPLLLCYWEGKTQEEAAAQLGWRKGTLKERVHRARELLRGRLTRRGVSLSAGLVTALLCGREGTAAEALALVNPTTRAALAFAAGNKAAAGGLSAAAVALAEGVVHGMFMTKVKLAAAVLLTLGLLGAGAGLAYQQAPAGQPAQGAQAKAGQARTDKDRLQGTWVAVSAEKGGKAAPDEFLTSLKITFAGDKITVRGGGDAKEGTFKLDPAKKPKEIDLMHEGKTAQGIYRLDGDKLTLCLDDADKGRPTEFKSKAGTGLVLMVLRREKAGKGDKGPGGAGKGGARDPDDPVRLKLHIQQLQEQLAKARDELRVTQRRLDELKAQAARAQAEAEQQRARAEASRREAEEQLRRAALAERAARLAAEEARAAEQAARQALARLKQGARRPESADNLKRLALAVHAYHDKHKRFPPAAVYDKNGKALLSWRVLLLPYLDQQNLFNLFKLDQPWDSPNNKKLSQILVKVFAPLEDGKTHYRVFTGPGTVFEGAKRIRLTDVKDGLSNTLLIVEADEAVPWTKPDELPYDPKKPLPSLGRRLKDGFYVAVCDGSVHLVRPPVNEEVLRAAITRSGGEEVDLKKLGK
jgi:RNA polymerase sigma factor (sigma-70 family)